MNCKQSSDEAFQPYVRAVHDTLHSKEITGMHEFNGRIATGSFDSSLVTSTITEAGIAKERVITGHHDGTISGVRFRYTKSVLFGNESLLLIMHFLTFSSPAGTPTLLLIVVKTRESVS